MTSSVRRTVGLLLAFAGAALALPASAQVQERVAPFPLPSIQRPNSMWFDGWDLLVVVAEETYLVTRAGQAQRLAASSFSRVTGAGRGTSAALLLQGTRGSVAVRRSTGWSRGQLPSSPGTPVPMAVNTEGTAYFLEPRALHEWRGATWTSIPLPPNAAGTSVVTGSSGQVFVLTNDGVLTLEQGQLRPLELRGQRGRGRWSSACWASSTNELWIGTNEGDLFAVQPDRRTARAVQRRGPWPINGLHCTEGPRGLYVTALQTFSGAFFERGARRGTLRLEGIPREVLADPASGAGYSLSPFSMQTFALPRHGSLGQPGVLGAFTMIELPPELSPAPGRTRFPPALPGVPPRSSFPTNLVYTTPIPAPPERLQLPSPEPSSVDRTPLQALGTPTHYYDDPPPPASRAVVRAALGGGAQVQGATVLPVFLLDLRLGYRRGLRYGVWQPALVTELGYSLVFHNNSEHLFAIGAGVAAQSQGYSFGWLPSFVLGGEPNGVVVGVRNALSAELRHGTLGVQLVHQFNAVTAGSAHTFGLLLSFDPAGLLYAARRGNQ